VTQSEHKVAAWLGFTYAARSRERAGATRPFLVARAAVRRSSRAQSSTFVTQTPLASSFGAKRTTPSKKRRRKPLLELNAKAVAIGLTVEEYKDKTNVGRVLVKTAVEKFIDDARKTKKKKTVVGYEHNLKQFQDSLDKRVRFIDEVTKKTLGDFRDFLTKNGYEARTQHNRLPADCKSCSLR
jgi:hypothetical protein